MSINRYYTIEKNEDIYVVWQNIEHINQYHGSIGSRSIFKGTHKECKNYCIENGILIKRGRR